MYQFIVCFALSLFAHGSADLFGKMSMKVVKVVKHIFF